MVHLQLISREGDDLRAVIRSAIEEGHIKSFEIARIRGGLRIRHRKFQGEIRLDPTAGPLLVSVRCRDRTKEWQLLSAFIGRLADHFKDEIIAINMQFEPNE